MRLWASSICVGAGTAMVLGGWGRGVVCVVVVVCVWGGGGGTCGYGRAVCVHRKAKCVGSAKMLGGWRVWLWVSRACGKAVGMALTGCWMGGRVSRAGWVGLRVGG
jgi:hypothetical protein